MYIRLLLFFLSNYTVNTLYDLTLYLFYCFHYQEDLGFLMLYVTTILLTHLFGSTTVYSECSGYMWLTEANRRASYKGDGKCDSRLKSGWYRFSSTAGSRMPDSCVPERRCNTDASGWLSGGHPSVAEGVVTRKVCFHWSGNCCYWDNGRWKKSIRVINCGGFYVYELGPTPECSLRYCGAS